MIATIVLVLGSFAFLVRRAYKRAGRDFQPAGKLRWTDESSAG